MSGTGLSLAQTVEEARAQIAAEPANPAPRHRLAELLLAAGARRAAEETVRETLRRFPRNPRAQTDLRAVIHARRTQPDEPELAPEPPPPEPTFWEREASRGEQPLAGVKFDEAWPLTQSTAAAPENPARRRVAGPPTALTRPSIPWALILGLAATVILAGFLIARLRTLQQPIPVSVPHYLQSPPQPPPPAH